MNSTKRGVKRVYAPVAFSGSQSVSVFVEHSFEVFYALTVSFDQHPMIESLLRYTAHCSPIKVKDKFKTIRPLPDPYLLLYDLDDLRTFWSWLLMPEEHDVPTVEEMRENNQTLVSRFVPTDFRLIREDGLSEKEPPEYMALRKRNFYRGAVRPPIAPHVPISHVNHLSTHCRVRRSPPADRANDNTSSGSDSEEEEELDDMPPLYTSHQGVETPFVVVMRFFLNISEVEKRVIDGIDDVGQPDM